MNIATSLVSTSPINSSFKATTSAAKTINMNMTMISIFVVLGIGIIAGCISMIYCYYVQRKNARMQAEAKFDDITPPILTLKENYTKYNDNENPNSD